MVIQRTCLILEFFYMESYRVQSFLHVPMILTYKKKKKKGKRKKKCVRVLNSFFFFYKCVGSLCQFYGHSQVTVRYDSFSNFCQFDSFVGYHSDQSSVRIRQ